MKYQIDYDKFLMNKSSGCQNDMKINNNNNNNNNDNNRNMDKSQIAKYVQGYSQLMEKYSTITTHEANVKHNSDKVRSEIENFLSVDISNHRLKNENEHENDKENKNDKNAQNSVKQCGRKRGQRCVFDTIEDVHVEDEPSPKRHKGTVLHSVNDSQVE